MKLILRSLLFAFVASCAPSFAAITHIASAAGDCTSTTTGTGNITNPATGCSAATQTYSYTAATTGNLIVFAANCVPASGTIASMSVSATGWTFTQIYTPVQLAGFGDIALWWAYAPNTSAATFTVTSSAACTVAASDYVDEFSGIAASSPIDNKASASNATTGGCAATLNSITPVANNTAVWSLCYDNVTGVGSGFTKGADDAAADWTEYKILTGGGGASQSVAWGSTGEYITFALTIAPATGTTPRTMPAAIY